VQALLIRCGSELGAADVTSADIRNAISDAALDVEWEPEDVFVDFVYRLLFQRGADLSARRTYGGRLRAGVSRERIIGWIMRGEEFRRHYGR
jgi:hypothetical protein